MKLVVENRFKSRLSWLARSCLSFVSMLDGLNFQLIYIKPKKITLNSRNNVMHFPTSIVNLPHHATPFRNNVHFPRCCLHLLPHPFKFLRLLFAGPFRVKVRGKYQDSRCGTFRENIFRSYQATTERTGCRFVPHVCN